MNQASGNQPDRSVSPGVGSTSRSLIALLQENEATAWERLVKLYTPLVYHWCRKMDLPEHDMADVFQEVFKAVAGHIQSFRRERPGDTFRGWLRTITRNKALDHYRRRGKEPQAAGGTEAHNRLSQFPHDEVEGIASEADDRRERSQLFDRALELIREHFEERTWQAFWRVVVDGREINQVAEELGMRPGTVRVAKSRVLHRLRQEMGEFID